MHLKHTLRQRSPFNRRFATRGAQCRGLNRELATMEGTELRWRRIAPMIRSVAPVSAALASKTDGRGCGAGHLRAP